MKRRIGVVLVLALVLSLGLLTVASAHAKLVSSNPAAGSKLTAAPAKVTLVFSEEISDKESDSNFTVTDEQGATVGTGKLDTTDLDHKTVSGALKSGLGDGVYTVKWNALTPDDSGHSEGSFTFGVNKDPGAQPTAAPDDDEDAKTTPTAAAGGATQPTGVATARPIVATTRPIVATARPTAAAGGAAPGTLPRTGEPRPDNTSLGLLVAALLLFSGVALSRSARRGRQ